MKENYTFTTNKTANIKDFSLLLLDYLSRDDEDVKTFGTLVKNMDGHTVMEIDSDEDTILFDRRLLQDVLKDIMNDVASLARANHMNPDEDKSEDEDAVDDDEEEIDEDPVDDDEEDEEINKAVSSPFVEVADGRIFHVGDRVQAIRESCYAAWIAGDTGVIIAVDPADDIYPFRVCLDANGCTSWVKARDFIIISE